ncbi:hypothetical protein GCM10009765_42230 [Fodinicola feengrottensis]|uniref:Spore-associated protein A n=1 Tax=Fodinicola feengrottensis TaxID=435914 RepID=A0ABN2HI48_9ACTN
MRKIAAVAGALVLLAVPSAASATTAQPAFSAVCHTTAQSDHCQSLSSPVSAGNYYLDYDVSGPAGALVYAELSVNGATICHTATSPNVLQLDGNGRASGTVGCAYTNGGTGVLYGQTETGSGNVLTFSMDARRA